MYNVANIQDPINNTSKNIKNLNYGMEGLHCVPRILPFVCSFVDLHDSVSQTSFNSNE